jgi:predicted kinase
LIKVEELLGEGDDLLEEGDPVVADGGIDL